jgi:hypothetical protein
LLVDVDTLHLDPATTPQRFVAACSKRASNSLRSSCAARRCWREETTGLPSGCNGSLTQRTPGGRTTPTSDTRPTARTDADNPRSASPPPSSSSAHFSTGATDGTQLAPHPLGFLSTACSTEPGRMPSTSRGLIADRPALTVRAVQEVLAPPFVSPADRGQLVAHPRWSPSLDRRYERGAAVEHSEERTVATLFDIELPAGSVASRYRAMILLATFTGLLGGELAGLRRHCGRAHRHGDRCDATARTEHRPVPARATKEGGRPSHRHDSAAHPRTTWPITCRRVWAINPLQWSSRHPKARLSAEAASERGSEPRPDRRPAFQRFISMTSATPTTPWPPRPGPARKSSCAA